MLQPDADKNSMEKFITRMDVYHSFWSGSWPV